MADPAHPPPGPQPDLALISQCHHQLSEEPNKYQNLPALDNGNAIILALDRLDRKLDEFTERFNGLTQRVDGLTQRFDQLDTRQQAA